MELTNYTRYNTEDLQKIVDHVSQLNGFKAWAVDKLVFSEFDPKNPNLPGRRWGHGGGDKPVKKYIAKMCWSDRSRIALLVPSKIYDNPLEALAQNEEELAPVAMLKAVVGAVRDRGDGSHYRHDDNGIEVGGLTLRVMKKAAQRKPKSNDDTRAMRNTYARRNLDVPSYDARRAIRELSNCQKKYLKAARTHLKERAGLVDPVEAAIIDAINALGRVIVATENVRSTL